MFSICSKLETIASDCRRSYAFLFLSHVFFFNTFKRSGLKKTGEHFTIKKNILFKKYLSKQKNQLFVSQLCLSKFYLLVVSSQWVGWLHYVKSIRISFFLVPIFAHSGWIRRDTGYPSVFSPNGKIWTRKTPNTDTFHAVLIIGEFDKIPPVSYYYLTSSRSINFIFFYLFDFTVRENEMHLIPSFVFYI